VAQPSGPFPLITRPIFRRPSTSSLCPLLNLQGRSPPVEALAAVYRTSHGHRRAPSRRAIAGRAFLSNHARSRRSRQRDPRSAAVHDSGRSQAAERPSFLTGPRGVGLSRMVNACALEGKLAKRCSICGPTPATPQEGDWGGARALLDQLANRTSLGYYRYFYYERFRCSLHIWPKVTEFTGISPRNVSVFSRICVLKYTILLLDLFIDVVAPLASGDSGRRNRSIGTSRAVRLLPLLASRSDGTTAGRGHGGFL